jgi:hypothetical protein
MVFRSTQTPQTPRRKPHEASNITPIPRKIWTIARRKKYLTPSHSAPSHSLDAILHAVHSSSPGVFFGVSTKWEEGHRMKEMGKILPLSVRPREAPHTLPSVFGPGSMRGL